MSYISQLESSGVYWQFAAMVDTEQLIVAFNSFYGRSAFRSTRYQIRDYRAVESFAVAVEDLRKVAAYDLAAAKSNNSMRVAVVIKPHEAAEALAYLYEAELLEGDWQYQVFGDLDEARDWCRQANIVEPLLRSMA